MARRRKSETPAMSDAEQKIAGMKSIDPRLDLGNGVTLAQHEAALAACRAALEDYNSSLAISDEKHNVFHALEKVVIANNKKILPAVGLRYGTDSNEYEMVGGKRESERKRPAKKNNNQS